MKKQSLVFKEQRGDIQAKLKAILDKASDEKRNVTDEELSQVKDLSEQRDALDAKIAAAELVEREQLRLAQEEAETRNGGINFNIGGLRNTGGEQGEKRKLRTEFSFRDAIRSACEQRQHDGLNKEVIEAGMAEATSAKRSISGIAIPSFMVAPPPSPEQRAQSVGTSTQSGALVITEIGEVIEYLYPRTVLREMGVNFWTGLTSNVDLIRQNGAAAATWEGENDDNANTDPTVESVSMRPKRLGAETTIGKQLMFQSKSISVENWIRNNLNVAQGVALETGAINGSGSSPIPTGLLNTSGIGSVAIGTNGGAPTWNSIVQLESEVADDNADYGTLAYLTTAIMRGKLKTTEKASSTAQFIWAMNEMNGYRAFVSTLVPKTLVKGTSSDCHAIIFGNWAELYIGQWDGLDIVVDPYTLAGKAQIKITVNGWYDIALRHKESFAAIKDARNV